MGNAQVMIFRRFPFWLMKIDTAKFGFEVIMTNYSQDITKRKQFL